MKNRFLKLVAVLTGTALVSGVLMVTANAHIGASHSPFTTDAPDLREAISIGDDNVAFCFDEEILIQDDTDAWFLNGFDSDDEVAETDVDLATTGDLEDTDAEGNDPRNCAIVEFDVAQDVENYTVAGVIEGAVVDRDDTDNENVEASVALQQEGDTDPDADTDQGDTDAPNLIDFEVEDEDDGLITFIFDEDVECGDLTDPDTDDAEQYGYYEEDGNSVQGDDIDDCEDNEVTVDFPNNIDEDDVVRVFIDPNPGVQGVAGNTNGAYSETCAEGGDPCTGHEHAGDATQDPDLESVERTDDDEFLFTFDESIEAVSTLNFFVYEADGDRVQADDCDDQGDDGVECNFDVEDNDDIVLGAVDECAVVEEDGDTPQDCNTIGDEGVDDVRDGDGDDDDDDDSGSTDAPDLESCTIDTDENIVTFVFDENVDEDTVAEPDESDLEIFDEQGNMSPADEVDDVEGDEVTAEFDEDVLADAVGCHVLDNAVVDESGNESWFASVGADEDGGTSTTTTASGSTTTATVTTTSDTTRTPRVIKADSTITIRYDRKPRRNAAFKGAVANRFNKCTKGRIVELHRRGQGVKGRDATNQRGNYQIPKRARRGRWFTQVLRKSFTQADGDTVICRPDESVTINVGGRRR